MQMKGKYSCAVAYQIALRGMGLSVLIPWSWLTYAKAGAAQQLCDHSMVTAASSVGRKNNCSLQPVSQEQESEAPVSTGPSKLISALYSSYTEMWPDISCNKHKSGG